MNPTGEIFRYDISKDRSERIGRPDYQRPYIYPGRFMWVDSRGRLYFSAGTDELAYYEAPYDPAIFNHIRYYDPADGFGEMRDWALHNQRAIDAGQCFHEDRACYLSDNVGNVYKFDGAGPRWRYLGNVGQDSSKQLGHAWVFHVSRQNDKAYIISNRGFFYVFDLRGNKATFIADLKKLELELADKQYFYGHNAWDRNGRFFFAAFNHSSPNVVLVAIDPDSFIPGLSAE